VLTHIHHINFVVADLEHSIAYFKNLFQQSAIEESLPKRMVKTARFSIGETQLVLVQPTSKEGVVAEILATKGEGIFLLSFATQSIEQTLDQLALKHVEKRQGLDGWEICDIAQIEQFGAILQLTQTKT
jgi:methylmalonyl-CoA/ethylmalonyl-CoA epimerase